MKGCMDMEQSNDIIVKEINEETFEEGLAIRNSIFPSITKTDWYRGGEKTGVIAFSGDEAVGFIPLFIRDIKLIPGITVKGAFENAVGTKEEYRGSGIGSKMIEGCKEILKNKVDILFVYRGAERSRGYQFYTKTGHVDLLYTRAYTCDTSSVKRHSHVYLSKNANDIYTSQRDLLRLFNETYQTYAGFQQRTEGFWENALQSPFYATRKHQLYFFTLVENNEKTAYMIAMNQENPISKRSSNKLQVLELASAGRDLHRMRKVIESATHYVKNESLDGLFFLVGDDHPFKSVFEGLNCSSFARSSNVMALCINPEAFFKKVWKSRFHMPGVQLQVWTPQHEFVLVESTLPDHQIKKVTIEMKDETLTQWLLGRIRFKARVQEGSITIHNGDDVVIDQIDHAIPHSKWEYHHIDYC